MPKRTGAKKGHKCAVEFDRYCPACWKKRLKVMGMGEDTGARRDKNTYMPQREFESASERYPTRSLELSLRPSELLVFGYACGNETARLALHAWRFAPQVTVLDAAAFDALANGTVFIGTHYDLETENKTELSADLSEASPED
jgi:hypothetical protein